jgi:A/G-specific adenine glycosylase
MDEHDFRTIVWDYYHDHARDLPWRQPEADGSYDAYKILVSEMMLQQTQVARVIPKYEQFLDVFPSIQKLAAASLADVIIIWSGLGYNRRAKYLHDAAKHLALLPQPWHVEDLVARKGIGANTAAAVCAYAYNQPLVFIETNIRTVFIHHFFPKHSAVSDKDLLPVLKSVIDKEQPREFYWALMDYGTFLKQSIGNVSRDSKHYTKQSAFKGSNRFIRGQVLKALAAAPHNRRELSRSINDERFPSVVDALVSEGLITEHDGLMRLAN